MDGPGGRDRRELLKACTGLLTGVVILGSPLATLARNRVWAVYLGTFSTSQANTLTSMLRTILPHDRLDDLAYAQVIQALDERARTDAEFATKLMAGLELLGDAFSNQSEPERVNVLKKIESSEFFRTVRQKGVEVLYSTAAAYSYFGYEGEAFSKGGYLHRGFNDLHWLPEVPAEDSGPLPGGG
jgi:hypothetical protein